MIEINSDISKGLEELRIRKPLIHNITNYVVMNFTANVLLSLGASPVMAHAEEEIEEMAGIASALVLNIGTLSDPWIRSMYKAGETASRRGIPIVLDPVGAGATRLRTETATGLVTSVRPVVVRGNASEILSLGVEGGSTKGVDSTRSVDDAVTFSQSFSRKNDCVTAITGPRDFITNGKRSFTVSNGHALLGMVTGTGCAATAVIAAFCSVMPDPLMGTVAGLTVFGIAGELAAQSASRPGSYKIALIDALNEIEGAHIDSMARIEEIGVSACTGRYIIQSTW